MAYSDRVRDVMEYVKENPVPVQGAKMTYEPFDNLDHSRLPDVVENLGREDVIVEQHEEGRVNKVPIDKMQEHMADVSVGMLYLACNGLDEAHDLVLPYSWPKPTVQGGNAILNSPAAKESEYCHAMVHRLEGKYLGELGMTGYNNACFWFGKTGYHPLFPEVHREAVAIAKEYKDGERFVKKIGSDWNPDAFTTMCADVTRNDESGEAKEFCQRVTNMEWRKLFDACNKIVNARA